MSFGLQIWRDRYSDGDIALKFRRHKFSNFRISVKLEFDVQKQKEPEKFTVVVKLTTILNYLFTSI
jgi:hypothetical protein